MSLNEKVIIVTGASSGIGAATAIILAREGANVVLVGRNEDNLNYIFEKCAQFGKKALIIKADVSKDDDVDKIIEKTVENYGKLDILVNNAGIIKYCSIAETNGMDTFDAVINTNLRPAVLLTNLAAPHLVKSKGNIVYVSSILGSMSLSGYSVYCASKAALNQFSKVAAAELAEKGVRVNTISPGPVETHLFESSGQEVTTEYLRSVTALNKLSKPEEIGELIAYIISDKAASVTGSDFVIDCGTFVKTLGK